MKKILVLFLSVISLCVFCVNDQQLQDEIMECYKQSYQYEQMGAYLDAIKSLQYVYKEYPDTYTVNLRLGWLCYLNRNFADSINYYKKAMKASSYSVDAMLGISLPLMAQERWSQVEERMNQVLRIDYYNVYGNLRLAKALRFQGKNSIAQAIIDKMLVIYPTSVDFLAEKALNYIANGNLTAAEDMYRSVLYLSPTHVEANAFFAESQKKKD